MTYIFLAFLIGGGLVLFGIGGSGLGGGLLDALSGSNGGSSGSGAYQKRVDQLVAQTRAHPKDASAWADLARARFQLASVPDDFDANSGTWNADGKRVLAQAAVAWERHVKLAGKHPDDGVAGLMVQAYGPTGLNEPAKAVAAQEVITGARPTAATFARLAVLAYTAGQTRKGDLASQKAVSLADKSERKSLKTQLAAAKQQAAASAASSATPMPTASAGSSKSGGGNTSKGSSKGSKKGSSGK